MPARSPRLSRQQPHHLPAALPGATTGTVNRESLQYSCLSNETNAKDPTSSDTCHIQSKLSPDVQTGFCQGHRASQVVCKIESVSLKSRGPERTKKSKSKEMPKIYGSNEEGKRKPGQEGPPASSAPSLHLTETRDLLICHLSSCRTCLQDREAPRSSSGPPQRTGGRAGSMCFEQQPSLRPGRLCSYLIVLMGL